MSCRICLWSGPRNVSTALMRSFENRPDTIVVDEPLYACYLDATGYEHPAREEILAAQPTTVAGVARDLLGPLPDGKRVYYQKHMTHHLLPEMERDWLDSLSCAFLIRDPGEVITSYRKILERPDALALGYPQSTELVEREKARTGVTPPIVDAKDLLENPAGMLAALCAHFGIEFDERMLSWPPGERDSDGVWAPHWYSNVVQTTGFAEWAPRAIDVPAEFAAVHAECQEHYDALYAQRLTV